MTCRVALDKALSSPLPAAYMHEDVAGDFQENDDERTKSYRSNMMKHKPSNRTTDGAAQLIFLSRMRT